MKIHHIFSKDYLLKELYPAVLSLPRKQYVYFHADAMNREIASLSFDFLTANILHLDKRCFPEGEIISEVAYAHESSKKTYEKNLIKDDFTPLTLLTPGSALFAEAIKPMDVWIDTPIWHSHCVEQDFHWVIAISYKYPHRKKTVITFHYVKSKGAPFHISITEELIEYFSFPFFLGWLFQYGAICHETLKEWLTLMIGVSPERFRILRALADPGMASARTLAENLFVSSSTVYKHLENSFDTLLTLEPGRQQFNGNANRILSLAKAYSFMDFGAASCRRILPKRNQPDFRYNS